MSYIFTNWPMNFKFVASAFLSSVDRDDRWFYCGFELQEPCSDGNGASSKLGALTDWVKREDIPFIPNKLCIVRLLQIYTQIIIFFIHLLHRIKNPSSFDTFKFSSNVAYSMNIVQISNSQAWCSRLYSFQ